ncbi:hypothetical protein GGX14DRAFT_388179 [Mycena pura]|uniref:Uncharacterized protein n=1 Tax=Mycena pura TaxID=153505 RepID=A0AAD6YKX6_9AGAR|nr:hypothetical protein GGX14DRAFT_388179 [Mycena pura]
MSGWKSQGAKQQDLLDKHHRGFIGLSSKWRLRDFTKVTGAHSTSKTNLWRVSEEDSDWFLRADGKRTAMESDNSHSVKAGGRAWLEERGITKFTYILVCGPKMGDPILDSAP